MAGWSMFLHHPAHIHFGGAGRDRKQTGRLGSLLDVAQLSTAARALPFHWKSQLGIEPDLTGLSLRIRAFILDGAAAVYRFISQLVTAPALVVSQLQPVTAGILHVRALEDTG